MYEKELEIIKKAAHAGGAVLREYFNKTLTLTFKSTLFDFQTEADLGSEKAILDILKKELPDYNIFSEEDGETQNGSQYTIVIDPLDGTNNFVMGIPNFTVSIAIMKDKQSVVGVVYQPILDQTYSAILGGGAFLNGKQIKVNNVEEYGKLTVSYGCGYDADRTSAGKVFLAIYSNEVKRLTNPWSPANEQCLLASGRVESFIANGNSLHDFAACKLIAMEAGAKVIDFSGQPEKDFSSSYYIISNTDATNQYFFNIIKSIVTKQ